VNQNIQWVLLNGDQAILSNASAYSVCSGTSLYSIFSLSSNSTPLLLIRDRSDLPTTPSPPVQTDVSPPRATLNVQVFKIPSLPASIAAPTPVY
jgi:hypothetical protein